MKNVQLILLLFLTFFSALGQDPITLDPNQSRNESMPGEILIKLKDDVELNNFSIRINVSNLNEDIYLLNITRDKEINKIKVVIKR